MGKPMSSSVRIRTAVLGVAVFVAGSAVADGWAGWPSGGGDVVIPAGETVTVTDADAEGVSRTTSVSFGEGATLVFANTTSTLFLNGGFVNDGEAAVRYTGSKPVVITADNTDWTGASSLEGDSTLIVSNRYGLGSASTPEVKVAKTANLWFGGNGLTNDVPIWIDQGMAKRQMQHDRAFGPFVQNGSFTDDMNTLYGDAIINGTYYCKSTSGAKVDEGRHFHINGPWSWGGYLTPGGDGTFHIDHQATRKMGTFQWSGYQNSGKLTVVFGVENAFYGAANWNLCAGLTVDLNGYDQSCTFLKQPNNYDKTTPLTIKSSSGPATLTMTEAQAKEYTRPVRFEGPLALTYSRTGKQIFTTWKSIATGELKVTSGMLEFADGAGWGGDVVNVTGGALLLSATDPLTSSNAIVTVDGGSLEIPAGVTAAMRKLVCGEKVLKTPGLYDVSDLQDYAGLTGEGSIFIPDYRPLLSATLDPNGDVSVTDYGDAVGVDGGKVAIPDGNDLSLGWASSGMASTRYEFKAEIASGELRVYSGDKLVKTVEASGTYDITAADGLLLRFESAGEGVRIHGFTNKAVITVSCDDKGLAVAGGVIGANLVPAGGSLTLTITRLYDSTMPTTGVRVNGTVRSFDDCPDGVTVTLSDAERGADVSVCAVYAESIDAWYVDCDNGDDGNKGYLPGCPKKTAQTMLDAATSGMTVYLLPGVYSNGTTRVGTEKTLTRLYVPSGVKLVGLGNKEEIVILGEKAPVDKQVPNSDGCGEDAVRCVYLKDVDSVVRNVTITGGRTYTDVVGGTATADEEGAGVCLETYYGYVVDCIISNCVCNKGAAIRGVNYGAYVVNCRICHNRAYWHTIVGYSHLYGTVFDHNRGVHSLMGSSREYNVVNCTFGPGNNNSETEHVFRGKYKVRNSIVYGGIKEDWGTTFYHCYFAGGYFGSKTPDEAYYDGCKSHDDDGIDIVLDDTITPVKGECSAIDEGADYTSLYPAGYEDWAKVDLYGSPRVLNGTIDVGAVEYDWRKDYAKDVYKRLSCSAASPAVVEADGKVRLADGTSVTFGWQEGARIAPLSVPVKVSGGALAVRVNGVIVATLTGDGTWEYETPTAADAIEFAYDGAGFAELAAGRSAQGLILLFR